jgi:hypothetical protein
MIYGTALLAACYLIGVTLGEALGNWMGVKANIGGVGIAMLLLLSAKLIAQRHGRAQQLFSGTLYWGGMYIPVVIAMALQLDVRKALAAGGMALVAAVCTVLLCSGLIACINRLFSDTSADPFAH